MNTPLAKPDISILDKSGHLYFGLTSQNLLLTKRVGWAILARLDKHIWTLVEIYLQKKVSP